MTDCRRLMDALGKGELPGDLAAHAASCPHCKAAVAAYRALAPPPGGASPPPRRSPPLSAVLERELAEAAGRRASSPLLRPLLLGLVQAAVAMGAVVVLGRHG